MNRIIQLIVEWAKVAHNWLKNFLKIVWGYIQSYWPKLKSFLSDLLSEFKEVIVLDSRETGGKEFIDMINKSRPTDFHIDDVEGLVTLAINSDNNLAKVTEIEADVNQQDQYDEMSHRNNGVLRINC